MKVEIRPIKKQRWHGKEGKEHIQANKTIRALVSSKTGKYQINLSEEEKSNLEDRLGVDLENTYKNRPHPFYDAKEGSVTLEPMPVFLHVDLNNGRASDFIKYKIIESSPFVANSMREYEEGKYPEATHVIYNKQLEVEAKAQEIKRKTDLIVKLSKTAKARKVEILTILSDSKEMISANNTDELISVEIDKLIESKPEELEELLKRSKDQIAAESLVKKALYKNIFRVSGHRYYYGETVIGESEEDTVRYMLDPMQNDFFAMIREQIKNK